MKEFLLIIDGSSLLYTQYFGNLPNQMKNAKTPEEKELAYKYLLHTTNGVYTNAIYGFMKTLLKILKEQKPTHLAICWDISQNTFRKKLYKEYKATRNKQDFPLKQQFYECIDLLSNIGIKQFYSNDFEADDFSGSISKKFEKEIPIKILTKDHDYFQLINENTNIWLLCPNQKITNYFYNQYGGNKKEYPDKVYELTPSVLLNEYKVTSDIVPMLKGLQGDISDNIPGVSGIGNKTAIILSNEYKNMNNLYKEINLIDEKILLDKWKKNLNLKRNPIPYLKKSSSEEIAKLSELLATINTNIPLNINLEDLKIDLNQSLLNKELLKLEMNSLIIKGEI